MAEKKSEANGTKSTNSQKRKKTPSSRVRSSNGNSVKKVVDNFLYDALKDFLEFSKKRVINQNWQKIAKAIKLANRKYVGETVAVLGPPAAGKTTLLNLLANQRISEEALAAYSKTEVESHPSIPVEFKLHVNSESLVFRFKVKKNRDVGGEEYVREQHWKNVIDGSAIVIYMIDSVQIMQAEPGGYRARVLSDFDWIRDNHQSLHANFSVVFAFNKIDQLCTVENYLEFSEKNVEYIESLKEAIAKRWPPHLRDHLKGGLFLSLLHPGLRAFTLNALVSCFVGDDLMKLLSGTEQKA